jgi:hypothetical protein
MNINDFVNKAWEKLASQGIRVPSFTVVESHEGEVLFVVEITNGIVNLLDARGTLFMIPMDYVSLTDDGMHKAMKDKLLPILEESLGEHRLANKVNKALLSVGSRKDSDTNKKRALFDLMIQSYHDEYRYFDD